MEKKVRLELVINFCKSVPLGVLERLFHNV